MGRMQRRKGKTFERKIAAEMRALWPAAVVRRSSQAERADNPDVFVEGGPAILSRLWLELQDARNPTPTQKLCQAQRDVAAWHDRRSPMNWHRRNMRLPVVVWHRLGAQNVYATTRLWVTRTLAGYPPEIDAAEPLDDIEVTISLDALWKLVLHAVAMWEGKVAA